MQLEALKGSIAAKPPHLTHPTAVQTGDCQDCCLERIEGFL
jgi:hypothetical protein